MNEEITEKMAQEFQNLGIERVKIRSVLTCESKRGICQLCYGRSPASGKMVELGEACGIVAAQSIGEPGTQLTMRTFHVGGIAMGGAERSKIEAKNDGVLKFNNVKSVENKEGTLIVVNRNANIAVLDHRGREVEHYQVPYGARILVGEGQEVKSRQAFAEWDPFNTFILTEETGTVRFHDVVLGVSMEEVQDEFTGLRKQVIIDPKDEKLQPQIEILDPKRTDDKGRPVLLRKYFLPSGANLEIKDDREGLRRRRPGQDPPRGGPHQGHHGRPAPGRRAVRGPAAQAPGRHLRDRRDSSRSAASSAATARSPSATSAAARRNTSSPRAPT